jgi:saccharopine dehydrogenase (NAD+, L-glutamate forming)
VVRRSNALLDFAWGEDFEYSETMVTGKGVTGAAAASGIAGGFAAFGMVAMTGIGRKFLGMLLPSQGEGPKVDPENPGFYIIDFHGETRNGRKLHTRVEGDGDPGYGSTSKMLAESAVCLALEEEKLGIDGGFWTPASAMGNHLLKRLENRGGLTFTVIDD